MASLLDEQGRLNVANYNEKVRKQRETFGYIDAAMATLEQLPAFSDEFLNRSTFVFSESPLGFLFNIIKVLGVSEETLKKWIVEILVYVLPTVEIGVKAALLSNIKKLISCNSDPRIPLRLRKKVTDSVYTNILTGYNEERGIYINPDVIDPEGILNLSPFTQPGMMYYFGCTKEAVHDSTIQGVESEANYNNVVGDANTRTAKLVRADDFNAFLWYVIHKGNKQNPFKVTIENGNSGFKTFKVEGDNTVYNITSSNNSILGPITIETADGIESNIIAGNTFYDVNCPNYISICIKSETREDGTVYKNTIVPISSDWFSCNWYVDNTDYYGENLGIKKTKPRNYSKEKAICNLRYCQRYDYKGNVIPNTPASLRFTILPKPYVLLPEMVEEISGEGEHVTTHFQWKPIRLLFDAEGNADQKGKFSLISETYNFEPTLSVKTADTDNIIYNVRGIKQGGVHDICTELTVNKKTGAYSLKKTNDYKSALVECYPGLTVYEFNYDYIMGMKLFDPKVVCQKIFDNAANPMYDAYFAFTLNKLKDHHKYPYFAGKQKIIEIVQNILEEDDDEINDCFYSFSNEQYDEMLRKTEEIKYHQMPFNQGYNEGETVDFSSVTAILNNFPENGSLEEQKDAIDKAISQACVILDERDKITALTDKSTIKIDFLTNLLEQLVKAIVDAVLSPKVLMLLMVNNILMNPRGEVDDTFNTEQLLRILENVIKALIREVRDLIMQKLLDYILEELTPMSLQIQERVASEQFDAYMAIIKLLLRWFNKGVQRVSRLNSIINSMASRYNKNGENSEIDLASIINDITYADIYPDDIKDKEPIINNC